MFVVQLGRFETLNQGNFFTLWAPP